ncbi:MAG: hypothetical protein L7R49_03650 [Nitrosopumilus sp.]|jgi:hypothetical protein|nr:hypothetical protein [Nitrosopumilus sp.]|tara:strand:+ start:454 stop:930 length:477 start_codon:yes stop_codon:yes gene_type:complete
MGIQDLKKLFEINQQIKQIDEKNHYNFIIDTDTKEGKTRIVIDEFGTWKKTPCLTEEQATEYRRKGFRQFVPDLIDFKNKIIIEYQEECKGRQGVLRRRGKINKKGHDEFSDEDKDIFYELAEFNQLKIWENTPQDEQDEELKNFLRKNTNNKNNFKN